MKKLFLFLIILFVSILASASTTTVTATVHDPDGTAFANGLVIATFWPTPNRPGPFTVNGASFPQLQSTFMDGSGHFSLTLTDNLTIQPSGSKWSFNICSNTTAPCFTAILSITGASLDISASVNAIAPLIRVSVDPTVFTRAYDDTEVSGGFGAVYYRVSTNKLRVNEGTLESPNWQDIGGGAAGCSITGTNDTDIIFNEAGNCAGSDDFVWQYATNTLVAGFNNSAILNWFAGVAQTEYAIDSDGGFYFDGDHTGFNIRYNPSGSDMFFTSSTKLIFQNEGLGDTNFIELNTTNSFPSVLLHTGSGSSQLPQLELSSANSHQGDTILQSDIIQLSNADGGQGATHGFSVDATSSNSGSTLGGSGGGYFEAQSVNTQSATGLEAKASSTDHTKEIALQLIQGSFKANSCDVVAGCSGGNGSITGSSTIVAAGTTRTITNAYVTASSKIIISRDDTLGTLLSVTCNTQSSLTLGTPRVTTRTAGTSFVVSVDVAPTTNPLCFTWAVIN